ncbi:MAG: Xaa-Pro peptidase family protein [Planctomycetota bacterium]
MPSDRYPSRRQKLLADVRKQELASLLITNETNVRYLTGFTGDSTYLLLTQEHAFLISDSRYTTQIAEECTGLEIVIRPHTQKMHEATAKVIKKAKLAQVGFESGFVTVDTLESWKKESPTTDFVSCPGLVEELRTIKDADEIAEIRTAVRMAEKGFATLRATLRQELTELEVAHDLEHAMRKFGASGASFPPIVGVGPRGALPHGRPSTMRISEADSVLIDWGANSPGGYKSDLTRILVTGKVSAKLEKVYRVVLTAQRLGIAAIRPGVKGCDVDAVARQHIEQAGFGKYFGHSLGHGIGLDIHEGPRLAAISETVLKPGMVVTVEPGIYLPNVLGVRIEDDVLVTKDGCEVLTSVPKELEQMIVD